MADTILIVSETPSVNTLIIERPGPENITLSIEVVKESVSILTVGINASDVMLKSIYDPRNKNSDAFDLSNMD